MSAALVFFLSHCSSIRTLSHQPFGLSLRFVVKEQRGDLRNHPVKHTCSGTSAECFAVPRGKND